MKKQIIITEDDGCIKFHVEGFTPIEVIGVLRFYEKDMWLKMQDKIRQNHKQEIKNKLDSDK